MDLKELGKKAIPGAAPAGQDARNDPDFEMLAAEIEKLSSPTFSGSVDWDKIIVVAARILEEKSKDLLVMIYLCAALQKREGLAGLAKGIHVLREAVETFWEEMFPAKKRMRGRKNAIEWLVDRLKNDLPSMPQEQWEIAARDLFLEDLNALDRFLSENMEDAPLLIPLINEISSLVVVEEKPPATQGRMNPPAPSTSSSPQAANAPPVPSPESDPANTDTEKLLKQAFEYMGRVATMLGSQEPPNPLSFKINRIAAWSSVTEIPPATSSKTYIPGPDSQVISSLQSLYQSRNWKELAKAAESRVRQFLFWLDLSHYVSESLEQLGCTGGAEVVNTETLQYLKRLPGLERLSFEDGTPFASEITREWLRSLQERQPGTTAAEMLPGAGGIQDRVEAALVAARVFVRDNKLTDALRQYHESLTSASSMKERFLWQQGLCRLLFEIQQPQLALPQIEEMLAVIDLYRLEQWEPTLAAEAFPVILTGLRLQPEKKDEQLRGILNRLAKLDPAKAMDFM